MNTRNTRTLEIAVAQTATLALNSAKLDYLLAQAKSRQCRLVVLGEYACNTFFKELEQMPRSFVREQGERFYQTLGKLSRQYQISIIAPLARSAGDGIYKSIYRFTPKKIWRFDQQILMDYGHWNEASFFANSVNMLKSPPIFRENGFRIGVLSGFELHFDALWHKLIDRNVDVVIVPTCGTFESFARWQTLAKTRSMTGGCYLLRANRIGEYLTKPEKWVFYGNSFICNPFGEIENALDDKEGVLVASIDRDEIGEAKKTFGFRRILKKYEAVI
ncbi:MAG: carbon-nitrogen hydrolase family protein [Helicobacteraceae bacterium]|nr:carbon-nitrogen hydrolase family protein [Helicobacteraceae bacterium]